MANCDIQNGRLDDDCLEGLAGIKTVFFMRHSQLAYTKNIYGEIDGLGPGVAFRFEQDEGHGSSLMEIVRGESESQFVRLQVDFTLFYSSPEFAYTINHLKLGQWAIFCLDYNDKIRLFGESTPMQENGGIDQSGETVSDNLYTNFAFGGVDNAYGPYLEDYNEVPFDNFPGIIVTPPYVFEGGLLIYNDAGEYYNADDLGNKLKHG